MPSHKTDVREPHMPNLAPSPSSGSLSTIFSDASRAVTENDLADVFARRGPSDLVIRTRDGQEYHVHKKVICHRSKFFEAAANGAFKEALSGVIVMENDPSSAVAALLLFLYTGDYDKLCFGQYQQDCLFHLDVYHVGSLYDVAPLRRRATYWFTHHLYRLESSVALPLVPQAVSTFHQLIPYTMDGHDRSIHDVLTEFSTDHLSQLLQDPAFLDVITTCESFRTKLTSHMSHSAKRVHSHILELRDMITKGKETDLNYSCPGENCRNKINSMSLLGMRSGFYCPRCQKVYGTGSQLISLRE
ncbi:hypothetical protein IWZ00DRAFT_562090 [Phyllosticta capitalensis]